MCCPAPVTDMSMWVPLQSVRSALAGLLRGIMVRLGCAWAYEHDAPCGYTGGREGLGWQRHPGGAGRQAGCVPVDQTGRDPGRPKLYRSI